MTFLVLQAINAGIYLLVPIGAGATIVLSFFLGAFQGALASGMLPTNYFRLTFAPVGRAFAWAAVVGLGP